MNTLITCKYDNNGTTITAPGKFEGEPVFAPYLWDLGLSGFADGDDGRTYLFKFTSKELNEPSHAFATELKAWLGRKRTLRMTEDSVGFVHCY